MKNTTRFSILVIIKLLFLGSLCSQCIQTDYSFSTQEEIDNFPNNDPTCSEISGRLSIINSEIFNLDSLLQLTQVANSITIRSNQSLDNLNGLKNVIKTNNLEISNNPNLRDANGIAEIQELDGNIVITNNPRLQFFVGLNKLENIELAVVANNDSIFLLNAFNDITTIHKTLKVCNNPRLNSLSICSGTKSIEDIAIQDHPSLVTFNGLDSLFQVDTFQLINNDKLILFPSLDSLENVSGQFIIAENDTLNSIINLKNLTTIAHGLLLVNNRNLKTIEGSENLLSIGKEIVISNNDKLESIEGLSNVMANLIDTLIIMGNSELSFCGNQFVCDYVRNEAKFHNIALNSLGCNSVTEILNWCIVDIDPISQRPSFEIFPNPVKDELFIDYDSDITVDRIDIYNSIGKRIISTNDIKGSIWIESLPSGKYFLSIITHKGIYSRSFIK